MVHWSVYWGWRYPSQVAEYLNVNFAEDPRLDDYRDLRDVSLRKKLEVANGLFMAEGTKVIRRAIQAGFEPRSVMLAERWIDELRDLLDPLAVPVYLVSEQVAESVSGFHVHRGALAAMVRKPLLSIDALAGFRRIVVCEDIVDHTNMGAIIRSAAALGWDGIALAPRCVDPFYRRSIKTSMGAVFNIPIARMTDWTNDLNRLRDDGFTIAALALHDESVNLEEFAARITPDTRIAFLLGTEGSGLSNRWLHQADVVVKLPMSHGIDSLNVAATAAIACYRLAV
jgi:tRNA G18 (ribose-2'-O)-methylase SpoU